jgi:CDP-diacylglycerol--serine O-phosphatidyltransferase
VKDVKSHQNLENVIVLQRKEKDPRSQRIRGTTIAKLIPNMITVASTCMALTGVRYALEERWEFALAAILIAAILDALDGRMARLLRATSDFGAQLDSLSDFVAFGISPALIIWLWSLSELGSPGWGIALFFAVCVGLRLARFNSRMDKLPAYASNYFQGIPAPAGAAIGLMPLALSFILEDSIFLPPWLTALWMSAIALLMVSEVPTFAFKKFKLAAKWILPFMVTVGILVAGLASAPWETLLLIGVIYLATLPLSILSFSRLRKEAERLQSQSPKQPPEEQSEQAEIYTIHSEKSKK